ncbi:MAG: hypothetical protein JNL82_08410 [Myxococcales bacterium]|nr:hypothetical protein [Myxococcales bacterium]
MVDSLDEPVDVGSAVVSVSDVEVDSLAADSLEVGAPVAVMALAELVFAAVSSPSEPGVHPPTSTTNSRTKAEIKMDRMSSWWHDGSPGTSR